MQYPLPSRVLHRSRQQLPETARRPIEDRHCRQEAHLQLHLSPEAALPAHRAEEQSAEVRQYQEVRQTTAEVHQAATAAVTAAVHHQRLPVRQATVQAVAEDTAEAVRAEAAVRAAAAAEARLEEEDRNH